VPLDQPHEDDRALSFLDHLEELRSRLLKSLLAVVLGCFAGYVLAPVPLEWRARPVVEAQRAHIQSELRPALQLEVAEDGTLRLRNPNALATLNDTPTIEFYSPGVEEPIRRWVSSPGPAIIYLRPMDPFVIRIKAAVVIAIILALPVILFQGWSFIGPGLLPGERRLALPLIIAGSLLFPLGAAFAYYMLDVTLTFFSTFVMENAMVQNDAKAYLGFALTMMLAFGAVFELPLGVVLAIRVGLVTTTWLAERRKYIFIVLLTISAIVTPSGDPITLLAMALPLHLLFELSLVASRILDRMAAREAARSESDTDSGASAE